MTRNPHASSVAPPAMQELKRIQSAHALITEAGGGVQSIAQAQSAESRLGNTLLPHGSLAWCEEATEVGRVAAQTAVSFPQRVGGGKQLEFPELGGSFSVQTVRRSEKIGRPF